MWHADILTTDPGAIPSPGEEEEDLVFYSTWLKDNPGRFWSGLCLARFWHAYEAFKETHQGRLKEALDASGSAYKNPTYLTRFSPIVDLIRKYPALQRISYITSLNKDHLPRLVAKIEEGPDIWCDADTPTPTGKDIEVIEVDVDYDQPDEMEDDDEDLTEPPTKSIQRLNIQDTAMF